MPMKSLAGAALCEPRYRASAASGAMTPLEALWSFFVRGDVYGLWTPGKATGETVKGPVTADLLERHLRGSVRVGAHSTDSHDRVRWFVIDLDGVSVAAVLDIMAAAAMHGVSLAVEASKTAGRFHLWGFFAALVPAWKARALGQGLLLAAGWGHRNIEVFPKQDSLATTEQGLGNFVWLPWHGADLPQSRTAFLDLKREQWPPHADQAGYLMRVERIPV
jgi:hypothetical protein